MSANSSPIIILTGGSRGLGLSILNLLLQKTKARVTTISRSVPTELEGLAKEYPERLVLLQGDVGRVEDNKRAVDQTVAKWGGIDGLILNAGTIEPGTYLIASSLTTP